MAFRQRFLGMRKIEICKSVMISLSDWKMQYRKFTFVVTKYISRKHLLYLSNATWARNSQNKQEAK